MYIFIPKNLIDDCQNLEKGAIATVVELNGTKVTYFGNFLVARVLSANPFNLFHIFRLLYAFSVMQA